MKVNLQRGLFTPRDKEIWIYALDRNCIGISARFITSWKHALSFHRLKYTIGKNDITFDLPKSFYDFYGFVQGDIKLVDTYSLSGDTVLLTIETKWRGK